MIWERSNFVDIGKIFVSTVLDEFLRWNVFISLLSRCLTGWRVDWILLCFWPVRHSSLMEMLKQLLWKGNSHYFFFFCCRNANFSLYLNLKWEMNDLVLYSILVAMYQSYAELVWTDSSSFFLSMAEENGVDCAAVILQTWLNFSVYLWVSTNTLCILLPCIECFYFPLI